MTETVEQIVHESEAQRQFVRVRLPAEVEFEGQTHNVRDLSSGGIGIMDVTKSYPAGETVKLTLTLPFQDFSMDIDLTGHVQAHNATTKVLGVRFTNLTKQQISLLNHILKSYISGDIVAGPDLLNVVARDNFVKIRKQATGQNNTPNLVRQAMPLFFITLLGTLAALFVGNNVLESVFMLKASNAVVEAENIVTQAPISGRFENKLSPDAVKVKTGDPIGIVYAEGATVGTAVNSPCDCFVYTRNVKDGQFVAVEKPLVTLIPLNDAPMVTARIDPANAQRLKMNSPVSLTIAGSDLEITGQISAIQSSLSIPDTNPLSALQAPYAIVKIKPDTLLPIDLTGRPAQVMFKTF